MLKLPGMEFLKKAVSKDMAVLAIESLHASVVLNKKTKKISAIVVQDRKIRESIEHLKCIKKSIVKHGASESLFAYVNVQNNLSNVLGISIPQINSINAEAIGSACVEALDDKTQEAMMAVQKFFSDLINAIEDQYKKMQETHSAQKEALEAIKNDILADITHIDAVAFSKEEADVYAQGIAMDRISAINAFLDKLGNQSITDENAEEYRAILEVLGKKVESDLEIRDETTDEAEQTAPSPDEVFHEEMVVIIAEQTPEDMAGIKTLNEGEKGEPKPAEGSPAETGADAPAAPIDTVPVEELPAKEDLEVVPADYAQEKTLVAHGWTPDTIDAFISALIGVLSSTSKLNLIGNRVKELSEKVNTTLPAATAEGTANEDDATAQPTDAVPEGTETAPEATPEANPAEGAPAAIAEPEAAPAGDATANEDTAIEMSAEESCIDKCRAEASFYADALCVLDCAISELVSHATVLASKLKKQEVEPTDAGAVNVDDVVQSDYVDGTPAEDVKEEDLVGAPEQSATPAPEGTENDDDPTALPAVPTGTEEGAPENTEAKPEGEKDPEANPAEGTTNEGEEGEPTPAEGEPKPEGAETESNPEGEENPEDKDKEGDETTAKAKIKKPLKKFTRK